MNLRTILLGCLLLVVADDFVTGSATLAGDEPAAKVDASKSDEILIGSERRRRLKLERLKSADGKVMPLTPLPLTPIPDDPPPHEGAMIGLPHVIEPPDLLIIEVLEAFPGRPISGERLVRPDGKISLGFYGEIEVRGLTLTQAKIKIIEHLREFLPDEMLGLLEEPFYESDAPKAKPEEKPEPKKTELPRKPTSYPSSRGGRPIRRTAGHTLELQAAPVQPPSPEKADVQPVLAADNDSQKLALPADSRVKITIEIAPQGKQSGPPHKADNPPPVQAEGQKIPDVPPVHVAPEETDRVFVDVTSYNSKYYYVSGHFTSPGIMPWTGRETVLDAINYGGGFSQAVDPEKLFLYRPARGGKAPKTYKIDLIAIYRGDVTKNLQLFPGDRLVAGVNSQAYQLHLQSFQADTLNQTTRLLTQIGEMSRALTSATPELSPTQREALVKDWFGLWWKSANNRPSAALDEAAYRELLLKLINPKKDAPEKPAGPEKK